MELNGTTGLHHPIAGNPCAPLEQAIYDVIHENMRSLNLNYFMIDLKRLNANLGIQLEHTQLAFLKVEQRISHQLGEQR